MPVQGGGRHGGLFQSPQEALGRGPAQPGSRSPLRCL